MGVLQQTLKNRTTLAMLALVLCLGLAGAAFSDLDFRELQGSGPETAHALRTPVAVGIAGAWRLSVRAQAGVVSTGKHWRVAVRAAVWRPGFGVLELVTVGASVLAESGLALSRPGRSPPSI